MRIIIVGCDKVGQSLAVELNAEGHDVVMVDKDGAKVKEFATKYDLMGVIGNGATRETQKEAGVDSADLLIAVTGSDELNLLCCVMAKKASSCQTIARVKSPEYAANAPYIKEELGLAMVINPDQAAADEILRVLNFPTAISIEPFAKGQMELITFRMPEGCSLIGVSVREAIMMLRCNILVSTVQRDGQSYIPNGDFVFAEKDVISIIAARRSAQVFFGKIGYKLEPARDVIVAGGAGTTHYLADGLNRSGRTVRVVEKDLELCNELSTRFKSIAVIHGDPTDESLLREEGIARADAFVAMTESDEENILLSLFAKNAGAGKLITRINRTDYDEIISKLELDTIIYPKNITSDIIVRYVRSAASARGSGIERLYNIGKGDIEAAEFKVDGDFPLMGIPISSMRLKENVLIAAILRGRSMIVPRGQDMMLTGDTVVIVSKDQSLGSLTDMLVK